MSERQPPLRATERGKKVRNGLIIGGISVPLLALGITGIAGEAGGNDNGAERGEIAADIFSLTLSPDANLRYDPNMGDVNTNTLIGQPGQETVVVGESRIRVLPDTDNGTWYGLNRDWLADAIPHFNDGGDTDGLIWVNEQGVTHITHLEDVGIPLPDAPTDDETKKD